MILTARRSGSSGTVARPVTWESRSWIAHRRLFGYARMMLRWLVVVLAAMALMPGHLMAQPRAGPPPNERSSRLAEATRLRQAAEWRELDTALEKRDERGFIRGLEREPGLSQHYEAGRWPGHYPFIIAIDLGWMRLFEFLLEHGEPPVGRAEIMARHRVESDGPLSSALSPLHRAVQLHRLEFVGKLLAAGADVNATNRVGATPLALAVRTGPQSLDPPPDAQSLSTWEADRLRTVSMLLQNGANPLWRPPVAGEAVPYAPNRASENLTEFILTNAPPDSFRSPDGDTLVHWAAKAFATNALEVLLKRGSEPDRTNNFGRTPLHSLATTPAPKERSRPEAGKMYYFEFRDRFYATRAAVARRLLDAGIRHDLFSAAGLGDTNALVMLLATHAARINARDPIGDTALHWATRSGALSAVGLLLARGADAALTNFAGDTPLHLALGAEDEANTRFKRYHGPEIVADLLSARVPLEVANADGLTPLAVAAQRRNESVKLLLGHGALANPTNAFARPPLLLAAEAGIEDLINLLLDHGADPKARDSKGAPVLHILLEHTSNLGVIEHLVSNRRFGINDPDAHGDTLLHKAMAIPGGVRQYTAPPNLVQSFGQRFRPVEMALEKLEERRVLEASPGPRQVLVVGFLLNAGSDPNAKNKLGETPLHVLGRDDPDFVPQHSPSLTDQDRKYFRAEITAAQMLLKAGAKISARDNRGESPLGRAIRLKRTKWAEMLHELGGTL